MAGRPKTRELIIGGPIRCGKTARSEQMMAQAKARGWKVLKITQEMAQRSREHYERERKARIDIWVRTGWFV